MTDASPSASGGGLTGALATLLKGSPPAWAAMITAGVTYVHALGYQKAQVEHNTAVVLRLERMIENQARDIQRLNGVVVRLHLGRRSAVQEAPPTPTTTKTDEK